VLFPSRRSRGVGAGPCCLPVFFAQPLAVALLLAPKPVVVVVVAVEEQLDWAQGREETGSLPRAAGASALSEALRQQPSPRHCTRSAVSAVVVVPAGCCQAEPWIQEAVEPGEEAFASEEEAYSASPPSESRSVAGAVAALGSGFFRVVVVVVEEGAVVEEGRKWGRPSVVVVAVEASPGSREAGRTRRRQAARFVSETGLAVVDSAEIPNSAATLGG